MTDLQGTVFQKGQKVAYVYQPYSNAAIKLLIGYISRITPKTVFIVQFPKNIGQKELEKPVKQSRAVVLGA